jgi:phenylalanyl-tRNA synthetase alpha chain
VVGSAVGRGGPTVGQRTECLAASARVRVEAVLFPNSEDGDVQSQIDALVREAQKGIAACSDLVALDQLRVRFLGRKGELTCLLRSLGQMSAEQRPAAGQALNEAKIAVQAAIELRETQLQVEADARPVRIDVTRPARGAIGGSLHPVPEVIEEICDIFHGLGFTRTSGPDVELDALNFSALNFPDDHPARDLQDTFYVNERVLLRTQTSPVQIRTMRAVSPPLAVVVPGRVYRQEQPDASHAAEFHQIEGLLVDHDVSLADLKATVHHFVRSFFGEERTLRFRPHYFPFTEPSVEVDMWWQSDRGGRWLEIMGAGMVHPNVFGNCGVDPETWTGFAFGMGVERIVMVRHGIDDIRLLLDNDLRLLRQF